MTKLKRAHEVLFFDPGSNEKLIVRRLVPSELAQRGISGAWEEKEGELPDGAVIIAAITSCTNTSK